MPALKNLFYKAVLLIALLPFIPQESFGQNLRANLMFAPFYSPDDGSYLETYLTLDGASLKIKKNNLGEYHANVQITMIFRQDSVIKAINKYELSSPAFADTANRPAFVDYQRILLKPGTYDFEIAIGDAAKPEKVFKSNQPIEITYDKGQVALSGIQLLESFSKAETESATTRSGYNVVPKSSGYYGPSRDRLKFYAEVYNADTILGDNSRFLLSWYLQPYESGSKLGKYTYYRTVTAKQVNVLLNEIDIKALPSGNYLLAIEAKDKEGKLIAYTSTMVQRYNPDADSIQASVLANVATLDFAKSFQNIDTLKYYVRSLRPIATTTEKYYIDNGYKTASLENLQNFFSGFWYSRSESDPASVWFIYLSQVKKVNRLFGKPNRPGFDTDMGRVYLQYGAPDAIVDRPYDASDPQMSNGYNSGDIYTQGRGLVPYQIWQYYTLKNQRNRKFVFYSPHLSTAEFELLHSDAVGEHYNSNWQSKLYRVQLENVDSNNGTNRFNGTSGKYYNDPF